MNLGTFISAATKRLESAGIGTARLDILILLEDVTGLDRAKILSHVDLDLNSEQARRLEQLINQRLKHMPMAYLRGKTEFYGREFFVSDAVLEPRPESETLIELLKRSSGDMPRKSKIADVGAGSGALGITVALELPSSSVDLLEISSEALSVAQKNVKKHSLKLKLIKSDLLEQSPNDYDVLICNLPYIPDDFSINLAAGHEPRLAIFGGHDGLDLYRRLFSNLTFSLNKPKFIFTETLPAQHEALKLIANSASYHLRQTEDFIQVFVLAGSG